MKFPKIDREWEVFAEDGKHAVGAVRQVSSDHAIVYIEGFGELSIRAEQIRSVHDEKIVLALDKLSDLERAAIRHAHDQERGD